MIVNDALLCINLDSRADSKKTNKYHCGTNDKNKREKINEQMNA